MGICGRICIAFIVSAAATQVYAAGPPVPTGTPIDENYRQEFANCDKHDMFEGVKLPYTETLPSGKKHYWYECSGDPSRLHRLEKTSAAGKKPEAIIIESKVAHDADGSTKACGPDHGKTDNCETALMFYASTPANCVVKQDHPGDACIPADADFIPYVVIPGAGPKSVVANEFYKETKVSVGDYGVVIFNGKVSGVVVGDTGPFNKIGEGSTALLKKVSNGNTIDSGAITILFPKTHDPVKSLSPGTFPGVVKTKGCGFYAKLVGAQAAASCK
jgi:hypothetical protein